MIEKLLLIGALLLLGILSKNDTIVIALLFIAAFVILGVSDSMLDIFKTQSLKIGIILISIYAFIPIAKGDISHHELIRALGNWQAWIAIFAGILVTYFSKYGIDMMDTDPEVTTFVLVGIIVGILVFKGVASGPLIGTGIALMLYTFVEFGIKVFERIFH